MDAIHNFAREGELDNLIKCIENGVSVDLKGSFFNILYICFLIAAQGGSEACVILWYET